MKPGVYIIKDLENLTGIKAHTIRAWESRYGLLSPKRSDTNIRYYDDDDLKKILNVNLLYNNGHKISKIAKYESNEILELCSAIFKEKKSSGRDEIKRLTALTLEMDGEGIFKLLEELNASEGMVAMYQNVVRPYLVRIGELWQLNTFHIAHEHLFSNSIRNFLLGKIQILEPKNYGKKAMLFLPEKEEHELSLLFYYYLLKEKGWDCIYLGQKVPVHEIDLAYTKTNPDVIITSVIKSTTSKQFNYIVSQLLNIVPEHKLYLSGSNVVTYHDLIPKNVNTIRSLSDFVNMINL